MPPVDAAFDYFIVSLEEDGPVAEVIKQGIDGGLDVQAVEPESEDAGFALAFGVKVLDLGFFFFSDGVETWMGVKQVGYERKVEFWVAGDEGGWGEEFAAGKLVRVVEDLFGALKEIVGLEGEREQISGASWERRIV